MRDFVFPQGNEEDMIAMADRLGIAELFLCYPLTDFKKRNIPPGKKVKVSLAVSVKNQQEVQKARHLTEEVVCRGRPGIYEDKRVRYVIDFESSKRQDFLHHRNSGLNQVFIRKAIESGKTVLVNANQLFRPAPDQHVVLGRMMQNNRFFRKYRPDVLVVSGATRPMEMRSPHDLQNLLNL